MPWKRVVSAVLVSALTLPAAALAGNGGVAPPDPVTGSGEAIRDVYWVALAVCAVVFLLVEIALVVFVVRFRRRRTTPVGAEGPQIHGNTRLEIGWTIVPAVILAGLAVFALLKVNDVQATPSGSEDALTVGVEAHQFYWQYEYPNGAVSLDTLYLPVDRTASLELRGIDVIHSWWVPELTGKLDAIPGRENVLSFRPEATGVYEGTCAEHCGIQHAVMKTTVRVLPAAGFERWLEENAPANADPVGFGEQVWEAACAKCHLEDGSGLVGPSVAGNGTMLELESLKRLLLEGQDTPELENYMPAVGAGWPERQFEALLAYIQSSETLSMPPAQALPAPGGSGDGG